MKKLLLELGIALLILFALVFGLIYMTYPTLFTGEYARNVAAARVFSNLSNVSYHAGIFYEQNGAWPGDLNELIAASPHLLNNLAITKSMAHMMFSYQPFDPDLGYGFVSMNQDYLKDAYPKTRDLHRVSIRFPQEEHAEWNQQFYVSFPRS